MTEHCGDYLYYDEGWFVCLLPTGHTGRHRDDISGDDESTTDHRGMTVEWDQEPATVQGVVLHPSHRWGQRPIYERTEPGSNLLRERMIPCCLACLVDGYEDESEALEPCRRPTTPPATDRAADACVCDDDGYHHQPGCPVVKGIDR